MREEYKLRDMKVLGVGEHFQRMAAKNRYVQLEPDVAAVFKDGQSVNAVLRKVIEIWSLPVSKKSRSRRNGKKRAAA
jgi:hypothetical protein